MTVALVGAVMAGSFAAGCCWEFCRKNGHGDSLARLRDYEFAQARRDVWDRRDSEAI